MPTTRASLDPADLAGIIAEALARLVGDAAPVVLTAEQTGLQRPARVPLPIAQWAIGGEGGRVVSRGVVVQALTARDRADAELAAHRHALRLLGPKAPALAYTALVESRIVLEEACRMVVEPAGLTAATVEGWGDEVVLAIHEAGSALAPLPGAIIAEEVQRLHSTPVPPPPAPAGEHADADAHHLGGEPQPAP